MADGVQADRVPFEKLIIVIARFGYLFHDHTMVQIMEQGAVILSDSLQEHLSFEGKQTGCMTLSHHATMGLFPYLK